MAICKICGYDDHSNYYRWCKCRINHLRENFTNWTSGNEEVDKLIQEMQLKINSYSDIVFEWIPYNQFDDIKGNNMSRLCLAIWKNGQLLYRYSAEGYTRFPNKNIALKYVSSSQNIADEIKSFSIKSYAVNKIFGISQNPDTNDYILVLEDAYCIKCNQKYKFHKVCLTCKIRYSRDATIDNIIQKIQFEIDSYDIFEWIPFNQFDIKKMGRDDSPKVYSALWKEGLLQYDNNKNEYIRIQNEKVVLKYIYGDSQNIINEFNKIKNSFDCKIYGISKNSDTNDYILVFEDKYCEYCELHTTTYVFEWISYDQFNNIKEMDECDFISKIYSAVWKNGPSYYNGENKYVRNLNQNKSITLKNLCDPQNNIDEILNEIKNYSDCEIYGISQDSDTKDYIMVLEDGYFHANENEKIDYLIQKMQLKSDYDGIVFEWIPYNLFNNIKEMDVYDFTKIYSAVWENGPSYYNSKDQYIRNKNRNKEVKLKSLCNLQNITDEYLNVDKSYTDCILYGISQAPGTKDYIVIFQDDEYCEKCNRKYTNGYTPAQ
uniref:Uncharacterized protein n=1 Tax=Rhizophagus irregularis (strain DAOM 181602 / DAOM 197198 / MUCL 43194) TaxID=747089 RepID=U9UNR2_RHIID